MKKPNDYFEMLKTLSVINNTMVECILSSKSVSTLKIEFNSSQSELYARLIDEFIAPIDRSDIFLLSRCLEDIFNAVSTFEIVTSYKKSSEFREPLYALSLLCADNAAVFSELKNFKNPKRILRLVRDNKRGAFSLLSKCKNDIFTFTKLSADSVIIEGYRGISEILKGIYSVDTEIERIIINNN